MTHTEWFTLAICGATVAWVELGFRAHRVRQQYLGQQLRAILQETQDTVYKTLDGMRRTLQQGLPDNTVSEMSVVDLANRLTDIDREFRERIQYLAGLARHVGYPEPKAYERGAFMDLVPPGFVTDPRVIGRTLRNLLPKEQLALDQLEHNVLEQEVRQIMERIETEKAAPAALPAPSDGDGGV